MRRVLFLLQTMIVSAGAFFHARTALPQRKQQQGLIVRNAAFTDSGILDQIDDLWQTFPYAVAAVVCGVKASAADMVAQKQSSNNNDSETDFKRNLSFVIYGALYQGIAHEYSFNHLYPLWFGTGTDFTCVATKVAFNLLIQTTLVTLPVAYIIQSTIKEEGLHVALDKYVNDIQHKGLLFKCFALWGPVHCLTFSVIPEHWRVTFIAVISFFWLILFSSISANDEATVQESKSRLALR